MATFKQYELKNGTKKWMFQTYVGTDEVTGKEVRTTRRGFNSKREAALGEKRLQFDIMENGFQKDIPDTFQEIYDLWNEQYKNTVKESTLLKTTETFNNFILKEYGKLRVNNINIKHCQKVINKWFKIAPTRYKLFNSYVIRILDYAIALEVISDNPAKKITIPKIKKEVIDNEIKNYYTSDQLNNFLKIAKVELDEQAYIFFRVLAFTGIRKGECRALTWDDINFKDKTLRVNKTLARGFKGDIIQTPKTQKSIRTISLDDKTLLELKEWRTHQREHLLSLGYNTLNPKQLIFSTSANSFIHALSPQQWTNRLVKNYDIKRITIHGFRHTHCSLLFEAGASIQEVQDRLGHNDIHTTMNIYNHVTEKVKEETAQKFAKYVNF